MWGMNQGTDEYNGINPDCGKIKRCKISFDDFTSGIIPGKFCKAGGTLKTGDYKTPLFHPQDIPAAAAAHVQDGCTRPETFGQRLQE